ncbi:MAG: isoprenylcysteine carboxylmethyltransferase family protein [Pedosphaera sp.]|nr:isoprenylcysteine carboxylmethyltransferase family protein [Pedosphaera sp.]
MFADEFFLRRAVVLAGVLVYWGGVYVQARRVRKQIGRSPNMKPRTPKEKILWLGWMLVVGGWIAIPLLAGKSKLGPLFQFHLLIPDALATALGITLTIAGYVCTLWCYAVMGSSWRICVNTREKNALVTRGPYRWMRHPIYSFQIVMLLGAVLLLPTIFTGLILAVHFVCTLIKATDEEKYLLTVHGDAYREFITKTGRLFPKLLP